MAYAWTSGSTPCTANTLTCGPELAPFFSVVAAGLVVRESGMGGNADFIPFCARRNSISARQKYSILAPLSTAALFLRCPRDDKIFKIHSSEFRCRQSLRWKMDESSAA